MSLSLDRTERTSREDPDTLYTLACYFFAPGASSFLPAQTSLHQTMTELTIQCPIALIILSCQKMVLYISQDIYCNIYAPIYKGGEISLTCCLL